jgi:glycosyltransferase involved in cell wall biosynthesis
VRRRVFADSIVIAPDAAIAYFSRSRHLMNPATATPASRTEPPSAPADAPTVCVVIPVFNEQEVIPELLRRLRAVFSNLPDLRFETVFVDDGCRDRSPELLEAAAASDPGLRLVRLSRNFGHQPALTAGLAHAGHADAVVTMDADLQDPPELIPELVAAWRGGAEVVLAVRRSRQEGGLRRLGFEAFHRTFSSLSDFPVEANTGTFGLLARPAVAAFNSLEERHRFFPGLRTWLGFRRAEVFYDRDERAAGTPAQTLGRLVRYALDGLFSFSSLPLRLLTYTGLLIACCGGGIGMYFIVKRLLGFEVAFTGFTTLVTLVLFLGGVQLIAIGVLGEYLGRIYDEVKRRPLYLVKPPPCS